MTLTIQHIHIQLENNKLTRLHFSQVIAASLPSSLGLSALMPSSPGPELAEGSAGSIIEKHIYSEIAAYLKNPQHIFNVEIELKGTPFQLNVWKALQLIPAGETVTYGELAKQLQTSARAIGQACRTNPIPIIIPCHRVVAAKGLGGYTGERHGEMVDVKAWLLRREALSCQRKLA